MHKHPTRCKHVALAQRIRQSLIPTHAAAQHALIYAANTDFGHDDIDVDMDVDVDVMTAPRAASGSP